MSYKSCSHAVICKVNLNEEEIQSLHKTFFEESNVGYSFQFENNDFQEGTISWIKNFKHRFEVNLKEDYVNFFRIKDYFVFLVSSPRIITERFGAILNHKFNKENTFEVVKFPFLKEIEKYENTIKTIIQEVYYLEDNFYVELQPYMVRFNARQNDKNYIISQFFNGETSFGMNHNKEEWFNNMSKLIEVSEVMKDLLPAEDK